MTRSPPYILLLALTACLGGCPAQEIDDGADLALGDSADVAIEDSDDVPVAELAEEVDPPPVEESMPTCADLLGADASVAGHVAGSEGTTEFRDVTSEWGLPTMYAPTASVGDVNRDGFPDLYVAGWVEEAEYRPAHQVEMHHSLFIGCGGRFFEIRLEFDPPSSGEPAQPSASHIEDMDSDGLVDLVVAYGGAIDVLYQNADGSFDDVRVWERSDAYYEYSEVSRGRLVDMTIADFDQDGLADIYACQFGGLNPLLRGRANRAYEEMAFHNEAFARATSAETYASAFIVPPDVADERLLYLAHHAAPDQIWSLNSDFELELRVDTIPPLASMGVDYYYLPDGEGVLALISEEAASHFFLLEADHIVDLRDESLLFATNRKAWGIQFADFDNNGEIDAIFPTGDVDFNPEHNAPDDYRLFLAEFDASAPDATRGFGWRDASATAGRGFDGRLIGEYRAVVSADLDLDGCVDVVAVPMPQSRSNPSAVSFTQPVQVLRNRCGYAGNWVGFTLDDPGALLSVRVRTELGEIVRSADVQPGSGLGCDGASEQVHIGLGADGELIELTVRCNDGRTSTVAGGDLVLNAYNTLPDACPR
jgi:hypothetical protein